MEFYSGFTYGFMSRRGFTERDDVWKDSMEKMFARTGSDTLLLPVASLQDHAYSIKIDWLTDDVMGEADIRNCIAYARKLGKKVILKAMVNCRDGYWRAYINFFDNYVPCEPQWADWFASYTDFNLYLAQIAQELKVEMLCVGCEMVGANRRSFEWRKLIQDVRKVYTGTVTYNCDKYQESYIDWWDAVDIISSSGYYPINDISKEFDRIDGVRKKFGKPFMFMECGCPGREGSEHVPNDWTNGGETNVEVQTRWYERFTGELLTRDWIDGVGWWDWKARLYPLEEAMTNNDYALYGKPAEQILLSFNEQIKKRRG